MSVGKKWSETPRPRTPGRLDENDLSPQLSEHLTGQLAPLIGKVQHSVGGKQHVQLLDGPGSLLASGSDSMPGIGSQHIAVGIVPNSS